MNDRLLSNRWADTELSLLRIVEENRVDYLPEHPESFFESVEEPRRQVVDCIECGKVTARSKGSAGPDPS